LVIGVACSKPAIAAHAGVYDFPFSLTPSSYQLSTQQVIYTPGGPIKTVWDPGNVLVAPTALHSGDTLTFDCNLTSPLLATDLASNPDTTEMIYWAVAGNGSLPTQQSMPYDWQFLGTSGALLLSDISGTGVLRTIPSQLQGVINISQTFRTLNLTDSSFAFSGIRLSMTVPTIPSDWTISSVRLSFAADAIQVVPEPTFTMFGGLFITGVAIRRRWPGSFSTSTREKVLGQFQVEIARPGAGTLPALSIPGVYLTADPTSRLLNLLVALHPHLAPTESYR
jgi:hypothetical protein